MKNLDKTRNSNIERLRILSLFLIILGHFSLETHWNFSPNNWFLMSTIHSFWIGGKLGVNLFVLISGYFLVNSTLKKKSFIRTWFIAYLYSLTTYIFALSLGISQLNGKTIIKVLFFAQAGYLNWFVTAYLIMYLISPFLNTLLHSLSQKQFNLLLGIFLILSILKTVFHNPAIGTVGSDSTWLVIVYCFGAYIRVFKDSILSHPKSNYLYGIIALLGVSLISVFSLDQIWLHTGITNNAYLYARFLDGYSPLPLLLAIFIFIYVLYSKPFHNKLINKIASTTFAIYLIHDNLLIHDWLWNVLIRGFRFENSYFVIIYALIITTLVFSLCCIIDLIRKSLFSSIELKIVHYISKFKIFNYFDYFPQSSKPDCKK